VTMFDPRLSGGSYILKDLAFDDSTLAGGAYESAKFGSNTCQLTIAKSVWKMANQ